MACFGVKEKDLRSNNAFYRTVQDRTDQVVSHILDCLIPLIHTPFLVVLLGEYSGCFMYLEQC